MKQTTTETTGLGKKKILIIAAAVIIVALLMVYVGISMYFKNHFYLGTAINGVDVSAYSTEQAKEVIQDAMRKYQLVIVERDGSKEAISSEDIGLQVVWENQVEDLMNEQNGFAWIIKNFQSEEFWPEVNTAFDEEKLAERVSTLLCMSEEKQIAAQNAQISEYSVENGYEVVPSVAGTQINLEILQENAAAYVDALQPELNLEETNCYIEPEIKEDNEVLLDTIARLNQSVGTVITYQIGSSTEVLDASVFQPWIYLDEENNICLNDESLTDYVKSLAAKYDTYDTPKKLKTSYGGKEVTITKSRYGWKVDKDAEKTAIISEILAGEAVTRDLHYSSTANSRDGNDYGNSYVEMNLTAQHLFLYVDGKLIVESDFVSGNLSKGWDSPTGAYGLTYKQKDATLRGDGYATPVSYWMPFAGNVGMHDATWRSSFGGTIYKTNGSHGCINLPKSNAKIIFEHISKGFPVLCYELEGTESVKTNNTQDAAKAVVNAISAIGEVTLSSETAITNARQKYDALSSSEKKSVSNYQVLVDAENKLNELKNQQQQPSTEPETEPDTEPAVTEPVPEPDTEPVTEETPTL